MNLSRFSVYRPIFTSMLTLIVIILGGISLMRLPIDLMPDITFPTLSVSTSYDGAGPQEMEELVTRPIEDAMSAVPGVEEVSSSSSEGNSRVRISFVWGTDLDAAANDVRDRLDRVIGRLPDDANRPQLRKFDLAAFPVLIMGASSNLDPVQLRQLIDDQVKYRIERVAGVAAVDVRGGLDREIHVNLYSDKIKALGLPLDMILNQIRKENVNVAGGTIVRGNLEVLVRTPGEYANLDELKSTVITVRDGAPLRLDEIAEVKDAWQRVTRIIRINGRPGVSMSVNKQSGTNTVDVARGILKEVERINNDIPQINLLPIINTADYIERAISNVGRTALYGGCLAILVLLLFLRNIRSTVIIATAIPISVVATFALMYFAGFTLNIMTLGGLALGIGMLVDNAIVVLENIFRLRESGQDAHQAAVDGSEEVTTAIIASTLTTLAVFLPLVFVRGMAGVMFRQLSFVIGFALLCSLGTALTLVPMLTAKLLAGSAKLLAGSKPPPAKGTNTKGTDANGVDAAPVRRSTTGGVRESYRRFLHIALDHRFLVILTIVLVFTGSLALIPLVGVELMPTSDEGEVRVNTEMEIGTRLEVLEVKMLELERRIRELIPEIKSMMVRMGGSHWRASGGHEGRFRIALKSLGERTRSSEEIAADLRLKLGDIPGMKMRIRAGGGLFIFRRMSSSTDKIEVQVLGHDLQTALVLAGRVKDAIEKVDGVTDAKLSREAGTPEELVLIDRQKAADLGLNVSRVANMLQTVLSGTRTGNYRERGDEYAIRVQLKDGDRMELQDILDLTITGGDGQPVVLRNVVKTVSERGPVEIERLDRERVITVNANIADRDMGSIVTDISRSLKRIPVPRGFAINFGGEFEEQQKAFRELMLSLVLAVVLVFMVMACQFESLRDPFVVMFSVPMAAIGVILMLLITGTTLNVQSFIGCIMLAGIVVNNAILLVDHTNLLRRRDGLPLREAIEEAGQRRLRPILMTATTTILAMVPMAIGVGEGGDVQAAMARSVIGGLMSATVITLVIIPVMYSIFEKKAKS